MNIENKIKPRRQTNWDWRAAGNFICGGSGSGLLLFSAIGAGPDLSYRPLALVALMLIALGLFCVWLEIGRPLRSMNVFLHVQTSWMTREALVAPLLFLSGAAAVWTGAVVWVWLTALLAMLFLYCQARILEAAKGIPAWRVQSIVPLVIVTGLTEGVGLLALAAMLANATPQVWVPATMVALIVLRALLWRAYYKELVQQKAPSKALAALNAVAMPLSGIGYWFVAALALLAALTGFGVLAGVAGLLAAAGGWLLKYTIVVRASFNQGYALPRLPVRGRATPSSRADASS